MMLIVLVAFGNSASMIRRSLYLLTFACLGLTSGCAYERGVGWQWDGHGAVDTLYETFVVSRRSAEEQADYERDKFFNRD